MACAQPIDQDQNFVFFCVSYWPISNDAFFTWTSFRPSKMMVALVTVPPEVI